MIKPIYILIIIFLSINLKADYNVSNHDPIFIKNGVFVGKNEAYSYFELEAYGVYIEKKYSPEKRENLIEYIDYKDYLSFIASLSATQIANIPEFKLTPKIKLAEQLAREKREIEIASKTITIGNLMFQDAELPKQMNWDNAMSYCEDLNFAGFSDWRLPTIEELWIAYQHKREFRNMQKDWYWSSTISTTTDLFISESYTSFSRGLNFYDGVGNGNYQIYNSFVRCVRWRLCLGSGCVGNYDHGYDDFDRYVR